MTMTTNEHTHHEQLAKRRRYRRLFGGVLVAGIAGLFVAQTLGYPIVGLGLYLAGALGMIAVWKLSPIQLFDEREQELERRAGAVTLTLLAFVLVVGAPSLAILDEAGVYETPTAVSTAIWAYVVLYVVFGVVYTAYRYRA